MELHKDMEQTKEKKNEENKCSHFPMLNDRFSADCLAWVFFPLRIKRNLRDQYMKASVLNWQSSLLKKEYALYTKSQKKTKQIEYCL